MRLQRGMSAVLLSSLVLAAACGTGDGAKKVVVSESVCQNARFLRMDLGKAHKLVLDNGRHSIGQTGITFRMDKFPVTIRGELPEGAVVDGDVSTFVLSAAPGDESSIEVVPTFAGNFIAHCGTIVGGRSTLTELIILIV